MNDNVAVDDMTTLEYGENGKAQYKTYQYYYVLGSIYYIWVYSKAYDYLSYPTAF